MKLRLIAITLLLATLFGTFGCAAGVPTGISDFISVSQSVPAEGSSELLNLAATDEGGAPLFQIVYDYAASQRVAEQCNTLAADI